MHRPDDEMQPELSTVLTALNALVGTEVELVSDAFPGRGPRSGVARWSDAQPSCAPRFLRVGEASGMPVGAHRVDDVELVAGGVRWTDSLGNAHRVVPRGEIEQRAEGGEEARDDHDAPNDERFEGVDPEIAALERHFDELSEEEFLAMFRDNLAAHKGKETYDEMYRLTLMLLEPIRKVDEELAQEYLDAIDPESQIE